MARAEAERDAARHEASMARMDVIAAGSARAKVESELARVQNALAVAEEARRKAEDEASRLIGPDPDAPSGFPGWSRLVEFHCTIPKECTKGPHLKEK